MHCIRSNKKKKKYISEKLWRFEYYFTMIEDTDDIKWVKWIEKYTVGSTHPLHQKDQLQLSKELDQLNRALRFGKIIGKEQNYIILTNGDQELIAIYTVYHVGFKHKPTEAQ